jgi:hypothetical protein
MTKKELKKFEARTEKIHHVAWKFHDFLEKNFGKDWKNLYGWDAIEKIRKYAEKNKQIKICPCDDDHFSSSILILIPHFKMGHTVIFVPQNSITQNQFFLYPNHRNKLIEVLTKTASACTSDLHKEIQKLNKKKK